MGRSKRCVSFSAEVCFHDDVRRGDVAGVRDLVDRLGPSEARRLVRTTSHSGVTALHQACLDCSYAMVQLLLHAGADLHSEDVDGWQPLHAAAAMGHTLIVSILLHAGADPLSPTSGGQLAIDLTEEEWWETRALLLRAAMVSDYPYQQSLVTSPSLDSGLATAESGDELTLNDDDEYDSEAFVSDEAEGASISISERRLQTTCPEMVKTLTRLAHHRPCIRSQIAEAKSDRTSGSPTPAVGVVTLARPALSMPRISLVQVSPCAESLSDDVSVSPTRSTVCSSRDSEKRNSRSSLQDQLRPSEAASSIALRRFGAIPRNRHDKSIHELQKVLPLREEIFV